MRFIADLHVHSGYSRATSKEMRPTGLWRGAQLKGIALIGTGDFTHPEYFRVLSETLEPAEPGLYRLRSELEDSSEVPESCRSTVRFLYQAEVSSIYSKGGRTRKVHSIILAPSAEVAAAINLKLGAIGNIRSDGRPILGLDAARLLEIVLGVSEDCMVVPAHAWTPHFSVFGAASGFDSLEECYGDLTRHIYAIETGLSSDPPMNRRLSSLDNITLVSNSDAHSLQKLGREANVLDTEMSYAGLSGAIKTRKGWLGTIEFFPEEGKYHMDGHRDCGVRMSPEETRRAGGLCPRCGRKLTIGVMHRVEALADRAEPAPEGFRRIIPLVELIGQRLDRGVATKAVAEMYMKMLRELGNEFHILLEADIEEIARASDARMAGAISSMRKGLVRLDPGYDGQYGIISAIDA